MTLSAAIALLLSSPMLFFKVFLPPVQAQTPMTFKTPTPAKGEGDTAAFSLAFDAKGTATSDNQSAKITSGTVQMTRTADGQIWCSANIDRGTFTNNSMALVMEGAIGGGPCNGTIRIELKTSRSTSDTNMIMMKDANDVELGTFSGPVECSHGDSTQSMTGTTSQDSDGDGIPDSSDRCTHNSNQRCFKEGDTSNTKSQQQPSSIGTGYQSGQ